MANVILVCDRPFHKKEHRPDFNSIVQSITPVGISPHVNIVKQKMITSVQIDCGYYTYVDGTSVCLGLLLENWIPNWSEVSNSKPEGAYAIFRSNKNYIQLVSDTLGQRTIWYVLTDSTFIASTSQRVIISYLNRHLLSIRGNPSNTLN